jgi:hypothetical protein
MRSCKRLVPVFGVFAAIVAVGALAGNASAQDTAADAADAAKPSAVSGSTLSSRLQVLTKPSIAAAPAAERAAAISVAQNGPGSLLLQGKKLIVNVRFEALEPGSTSALEDAGAEILLVSPEYEIVTVAAAIKDLRELGEVDGVISVLEEHTPMITAPGGAAPTGGAMTNAAGCTGARTSEGDVQLRADLARSAYGLDGGGVKVGMISDSYDKATGAATDAAGDVSSGDLPGAGNPCGRTTPVQVLADNSVNSKTDEGRAQGQIIHDLAPGSGLAFATGFTGHLQMAAAIRNLAAANADVIVDDVIYFDEPMFQDGPISQAINEVTADGVAYFTSVGNNNIIRNGKNVGSYEAPAFRKATACPPGLPAYAAECMNFSTSGDDSTYGIRVPAGEKVNIVLGYNQPWFGVTTDYDVYLRRGNAVVADSENDNPGNGIPQERVEWDNNTGSAQTVTLSINRCSQTCNPGADSKSPRLKLIFQQNSGQGVYPTEYQSSVAGDIVGPTTYGHFAALNAVSVGATRYDSTTTVEDFSSRGPAKLFYGPVIGGTPAPALASPKVLNKPDVTATDCGANTFFGQFIAGIWRFCGTSAASPHAAAVGALQLHSDPALTPAQVKAAQMNTARPVGTLPATAVGKGLIDAKAAVALRLPSVKINDVSIVEGDSGNQDLTFTLTLSKPSGAPTSVKFATGGGTATAGTDYVSKTGRLGFPAGITSRAIRIPIVGDVAVEPNETFRVTLTAPRGLKITDATGVGRIQNDD